VKVVVYDRDIVSGQVNVQLDGVSTKLDCSGEGGQGILRIFARRAAVADTLDTAS
jgi:hypothetical protein